MIKKTINVIFFGTNDISVAALKALYDNELYNIVMVVTKKDAKLGRKKDFVNNEVKQFCIEKKINFIQPEKVNDEYEKIKDLNPDLILTCSFGEFISEKILIIPKYKCINVHASLLPKYRGGAPIHWALINDEKQTGVSLMYMEKEMDSGDILYQEAINISCDETLDGLWEKMKNLIYDVVNKNLSIIFDNNLIPIKQDEKLVTFGYNIKTSDEKINWNNDARKIYCLIKGLYSKPCAHTIYNNKIIKVIKCKITDEISTKKPGTIVECNRNGLKVATKNYNLLITSIKMEGKNIVSDANIMNYKHILLNDTLFD